jgi:hypothetical protein
MMEISAISVATSGSYCHYYSATKLNEAIDKQQKVGYKLIALTY